MNLKGAESEMALLTEIGFNSIAANGFIRSLRTQNEICRSFQDLFDDIVLKILNEKFNFKICQKHRVPLNAIN
jgi:hypothetical protein